MLLSLLITKFPLQMSNLLNVCAISTSNSCEILLHVFHSEKSQTLELKDPCDFQIEMAFWSAWLCHSADSNVCLWPCLYSAFCSAREEGQSPRRPEDRDCSHPGVPSAHFPGRRVWPSTLKQSSTPAYSHRHQVSFSSLASLLSLPRFPLLSVVSVKLCISSEAGTHSLSSGDSLEWKWLSCLCSENHSHSWHGTSLGFAWLVLSFE